MKNRYAKRSRISEAGIREVVRCFAADRPSGGGLNRNAVNRPRLEGTRMPARFGARCSARKASARRVKGRRGRGARRSFSASSNARAKSTPRSSRTDAAKPRSSRARSRRLARRPGRPRLWTLDHSRDEFANGAAHGGFRGLAKVRLAKFKGLPGRTLHLHLKETEWRYNHADRPCRQNPLS